MKINNLVFGKENSTSFYIIYKNIYRTDLQIKLPKLIFSLTTLFIYLNNSIGYSFGKEYKSIEISILGLGFQIQTYKQQINDSY